MEKNLETIKDKIQKLLNKARSAQEIGSDNEAETFAKKANDLLVKHKLEMSDLKGNDNRVFEINEEYLYVSDLVKYVKTEGSFLQSLMSVLAKHNFCKTLNFKGSKPPKILLFGEDQDRELVKYMFCNLVPKVREMALQDWNNVKDHTMEKRNTYLRGYFVGIINGINNKLTIQSQQQQSEYEGLTSLVVTKDDAIDNKVDEVIGKNNVRNGRSRSLKGARGYSQGYKRGNEMETNKAIG